MMDLIPCLAISLAVRSMVALRRTRRSGGGETAHEDGEDSEDSEDDEEVVEEEGRSVLPRRALTGA